MTIARSVPRMVSKMSLFVISGRLKPSEVVGHWIVKKVKGELYKGLQFEAAPLTNVEEMLRCSLRIAHLTSGESSVLS